MNYKVPGIIGGVGPASSKFAKVKSDYSLS